MGPGGGPLVVWWHSENRAEAGRVEVGSRGRYGVGVTRLWALMAFVVWVFAGGAVLAPWLWWLARGAEAAWPGGGLGWLVDHPFSRYLHRCFLVLAVLGLWPLARALGCRSWASVGLKGVREGWRGVVWGFLAGACGFGALAIWEWGMGARVWRLGLEWGGVAKGLARAMASAMAVGWVEEVLFRGVLFGGLRPSVGVVRAAGISSLAYATVHFFGRPPEPNEVGWVSGFETLAGMLGGPGSWELLMPGFGTLFLVGVLCALSYERYGTVYFAVGFHVALVFWMKTRGLMTRGVAESLGGGDLLSQWLVFALAGMAVVWWLSRGAGGKVGRVSVSTGESH